MDSDGSGNLIYLPIDKLLEQNKRDQIQSSPMPNNSTNNSSQQNQNQDPRMRRVR